ncbi:MAG: STAS domain-containing protein [Candidatus Aminicenantales bacterium]
MALTRREVGDVIIFDIEGDMTLVTIEKIGLHRSVKEMLGKGKRHFLLNFGGVAFMDSTGVGEFLASFVSIQNTGGRLMLEKINPKIRLVLDITGISTLFESSIFEDEEAAFRSFR